MRVLVIEPERVPYEKEIDGSLEAMQEIVGGMIQAVYPYQEQVCLVCNDEGKIKGMPLNRAIPEISDIIAGTFFISGLNEDSFDSLDEKQINQFKEKFNSPERFLMGENGIMIMCRLPSEEEIKWGLAKETETIPEKPKVEPKKNKKSRRRGQSNRRPDKLFMPDRRKCVMIIVSE